MKQRLASKKLWLFDILIIGISLWLDQFVKTLTITHLKGKPAFVLWEGVFKLQYLENRGSAFGMLQNKKAFLLIVGFVFMAICLYALWKVPATKKYFFLHLAISWVVAGGVGNMIDRIRYEYVVDLFYFVLIDFPIFNVADIFICCATGLLLILILFVYKEDDFSFLSRKKNQKEK